MATQRFTIVRRNEVFLDVLASLAPGTALRDGISRILSSQTGGLIVVGYDEVVEAMSGGGFYINTAYTPNRLRELAKMDGAIILSADGSHIRSAGVHLLPDGSLPTDETGTRHRTAHRVSQQVPFPVISVSESTRTVSLYFAGMRHVLEESAAILSRADQALSTLERYKARLDEVSAVLSELELEDLVTVRDVAVVTQRAEMVHRIASEVSDYVVELGVDGRLVSMQFEELVAGVAEERILIVRDVVPGGDDAAVYGALSWLEALSSTELLDVATVARALGFGGDYDRLDEYVAPRGFRLLSRVPRLPEFVTDRLIEHFGSVQRLLAASAEDLQAVDGVGDTRARFIRDGLSRMVENSYR